MMQKCKSFSSLCAMPRIPKLTSSACMHIHLCVLLAISCMQAENTRSYDTISCATSEADTTAPAAADGRPPGLHGSCTTASVHQAQAALLSCCYRWQHAVWLSQAAATDIV